MVKEYTEKDQALGFGEPVELSPEATKQMQDNVKNIEEEMKPTSGLLG